MLKIGDQFQDAQLFAATSENMQERKAAVAVEARGRSKDGILLTSASSAVGVQV